MSAPIPKNESERLAALSRYKVLDTPSEQNFDDLTALASFICDTPISLITFVDRDRQWFKSRIGLDMKCSSRDIAFCAHAILQSGVFAVNDARKDERFANNPLVTGEPGIRFYAGAPLITSDGHALGTLCVIDRKPRELSEEQLKALKALSRQVVAQLELRRALHDRDQLIQDLEAFAHSVAHDLKNPLSVVSGYSEMLISQPVAEQDPAEVEDSLQAIHHYSTEMNNIVRNLLLLSSVHSTEVEHHPLNMMSVIEAVLDRLSHMIKQYEASVILPERWPQAVGYAPWVETVWANYISNAIKYGGDPPRVALGADEPSDKKVRFWVKDNGPGIRPEDQERVFAPHTRLAQAEGIEGHGLGLSIVQRIVTKLGGSVGVESNGRSGSCFYFTLPATTG